MKTILSLHAHPDDAEAWCAGTLKLLQDMGHKIVIATMTGGGMGSTNMSELETIVEREKEAKEASAVLGADYYCFQERDGYLFDNPDIRMRTTNYIRKVRPDVVMTHLPIDYHPDHRATANIVEAACALVNLPNVPCDTPPMSQIPILYHTSPMTLTNALGHSIPNPHFYVNISQTINTKIEMLKYHKSQQELMKIMWGIDDFFGAVKKNNQYYGELVGSDYAEVFWHHGAGFPDEPFLENELKNYILQPKNNK